MNWWRSWIFGLSYEPRDSDLGTALLITFNIKEEIIWVKWPFHGEMTISNSDTAVLLLGSVVVVQGVQCHIQMLETDRPGGVTNGVKSICMIITQPV